MTQEKLGEGALPSRESRGLRMKKLFKKYREMILYMAFGAITVAVNFLTYLLMSRINDNTAVDTAADTEKKDVKKSSARKPKTKRVEGKADANTESNLDVNSNAKPKPSKAAENSASEEKTAPEKSAKPKRTRSRAKSTASAEQTLNNIAEDVNALMAEVEKLTKNAQ